MLLEVRNIAQVQRYFKEELPKNALVQLTVTVKFQENGIVQNVRKQSFVHPQT